MSLRPLDHGALGHYSVAVVTGTIAASLTANSTLFSVRWGNASNLMVVEEVVVMAQHVVAAAAVAQFDLEMIIARTFTASDTGGSAVALTTNNAKRRTNMGTSLVTDMRIATTGTLTPGTRTLDSNSFGRIQGQMQTTIGGRIFDLQPFPIWRAVPGIYPLVLAQDEGFLIRNPIVAPATATWVLMVGVRWAEVVSYGNAQLG
jgi:hypothetical protein